MNELLRRRIILGIALIFTLWAAWQVSQPEEPGRPGRDAGIAGKRAAQIRPAPSAPIFSGELNLPERPGSSSPVHDIFELPKPPVVAAPKAVPVAPPLQYTYLGRLEEKGQTQIFLGDGNQALVVKIGARLPNGWTLESMETGRLNFSHAAPGQKQTLQIGDY